jgi:hypothetical protein
MDSRLHNLERYVVTDVERYVGRHWHLGHADCARIHLVRRAGDLEYRQQRVRVVERLGANAHVDVYEG